MNVKLIKLLASVCIVLLLIIIAEWLYARHAEKRLRQSIAAVESQPHEVDELPALGLTKQPEDKYADLVARPLFIKGRKSVETVEIAETATAGSDTFDWQLNGVYTKGGQFFALFSRAKASASEKNNLRIIEGDDISGWTLAEIHKDKVILRQGSHQKELMLRKPKLKELPRQKSAPIPTPKAKADTSGSNDNE